jgi:hypothetical protein
MASGFSFSLQEAKSTATTIKDKTTLKSLKLNCEGSIVNTSKTKKGPPKRA